MLLSYDFKILNANALKQVLESNEQRVKRHNAILARSMQDTSRQATAAQRQASAPNTRTTVDNELKRQVQQHDRYWNQAAKRAADYRLREELRVERHLERERRSNERKASVRARASDETRLGRVGSAGRSGMATLGSVGRTALTVAGIGGGFLAASAVQSAIERRQVASQLANQIRQPELKGALEKEASGFAGFRSTEILGAEKIWHGLTGDIENVRKLMPDITDASLATGASLDDLASALGNTFVQIDQSIKDPEEKLKQMRDLLKSIAGMGTIGGIDIQQLAPVMAGLAAQGGKFQGGAAQAIKMAVAQAEASRMSGGSASPEEAATAVQRFADDLIENKKAYQAKGINVYADKGKTKLRSQAELIPELMDKAGGNLETVASMFGIRAKRAVEPYRNIWLQGGGKNGGKAAVSAYLQKFMDAKMTDAQIKAGVKSRLEDPDLQLKEALKSLQNAIGQQLLPEVIKLIPKIAEATPTIARLMSGVAKVADFLMENPLKGIGAIVLAVIAKDLLAASIGSKVRELLLSMMRSGGASGGGGGGRLGGKLGGALGAAGMGAAIGIPLATALYGAGTEEWKSTTKSTDALSRELAGVQGPQLATAIISAKNRLKEIQSDRGMFGSVMDFFGAGNGAEVKGIESLIKRKEAELADYQRTGKVVGGGPVAQGGGAQGGLNTQALDASAGGLSAAAQELKNAAGDIRKAANAPNRTTVPSSPKA